MGTLWLTIPAAAAAGVGGLIATIGRRVVHPTRSRPTPILATPGPRRIVLQATPMTKQAGTLGFLYNDESEHAVLGPITRTGTDEIERHLTIRDHSPSPTAGSLGRPVGNVFASAQDVDPQAQEVHIPTELGDAPAWLFPGAGDAEQTWAIHIHGILSGRDAAFRTVHALASTGYTSLVPSFRGDGEGPAAPLGAFTLGQTEWPDVDAALNYAIEHGAKRIVLVGWSSGASISLQLTAGSPHHSNIAGLILVSPVLNWRNSIIHSAATVGVPRGLVAVAVTALGAPVLSRLLGTPVPLDFFALDWMRGSASLEVPVLLIHSEGDKTTPLADTRQFHELQPRSTLVVAQATGHALEWNADPERFEAAVQSWCAAEL